MTATEAARLIGCHPRYVRSLIVQGKLRATVVPVGDDRLHPYRTRYDVTLEEVRSFLREPQSRGWPRGRPRNH